MKRITVLMAVAALVSLFGLSLGCRHATPREPRKSSRVQATIPADSPLAKIEMGMRRSEVTALIGEPTSTRKFPSGKLFNPFYYGPDNIRTGAIYKGLGRVVFSGADIVVQIEYDPAEDGY